MRHLMRSFLRLLKKDSATALSQRLPRRLMLGAGSWSLLPAYEVVAAELTIARDTSKAGRPARWHSTGWISSACSPTEFTWVCCISWVTRFSPHRVRHGLPGVVPAVLYLEYTTHAAQAKLGATLGHECVLHPDSLCYALQADASIEIA
jgi:hypothetical protein